MALIFASMLLSSAILMHIEAGDSEKGVFTIVGSVTLAACLFYLLAMALGAWRHRDR